MDKQWKASPYRYLDGKSWNDDRYEIFVWENGRWVNVGGAIRKWGGKTIAWLCLPNTKYDIRTPRDAEQKTDGLYVWGVTVKDALNTLKATYPHPSDTLRGWLARVIATF
jgi:hypothetical protein